ncbi:MAG: DUF1911 domain-containing protein [Pseudomonadales bacterium]|nr:DUF1911 domain-containing protein [Pseudomonadales bacterium]
MSTELLFESEYAMLLGAYSLDDSTEFLTGISSYLASWYKGHKGCVWFDSHLADGPAYFGYWSFEAAAVLKAKKICKKDIQPNQYLPLDLLAD